MTRSRFTHLLTAIVALLALTACGSIFSPPERQPKIFQPLVGYPDGFEEAQHEAWWNRRTPEADLYYKVIDKEFGEEFRAAMKHCRWDVNETRGATFLYRLDSFGSP